jgi:oxaloacetate decarboxylase alpha subunit
MKQHKVSFTETALRDANQSLIATRLPYDKFEPILETMDKAGFYSVECWGGATFDSCLRFLNEDPWERLRKIKAKMPNTKLQMLLKARTFWATSTIPMTSSKSSSRFRQNGIDIIRIFDALNDTRNVKVAVEETVKRGAIASVLSPTPPALFTLLPRMSSRSRSCRRWVFPPLPSRIWQRYGSPGGL